MRTRFALGVMLLVALSALPACKRKLEPRAAQPDKVSLAFTQHVGLAPFFIAQEEGYYREANLDVRFIPTPSSSKVLAGFLRGDIDVSAGNVSVGMLNAIGRGARVRIVAGKGSIGGPEDAYFALVARRELVESGRLKSPSDLKGLRIACTRAGPMEYCLSTLLKRGGLSDADVTLRDLPNPIRAEALGSNALDAVLSGEPWATREVKAGGVVWMTGGEIIPGFEHGIIAYGERLLDRDAEVGRRFMAATFRGILRYNEGKTERNVALICRHTGLAREELMAASWPQIRNDGAMSASAFDGFQNWALEKDLLDRRLTSDEYWDGRFVEHANSQLREPGK